MNDGEEKRRPSTRRKPTASSVVKEAVHYSSARTTTTPAPPTTPDPGTLYMIQKTTKNFKEIFTLMETPVFSKVAISNVRKKVSTPIPEIVKSISGVWTAAHPIWELLLINSRVHRA